MLEEIYKCSFFNCLPTSSNLY